MRGVSHVAIGVSDMDRALGFYRDVLGLKVALDAQEKLPRFNAKPGDPKTFHRHAVYMRWNENDPSFVVLSQNEGEASGKPLKLDQVGIHHFSFWVDDLRERFQKMKAAGVKFFADPAESAGEAYGLPHERRVLTCLFQDPDGTVLQFDQLLN